MWLPLNENKILISIKFIWLLMCIYMYVQCTMYCTTTCLHKGTPVCTVQQFTSVVLIPSSILFSTNDLPFSRYIVNPMCLINWGHSTVKEKVEFWEEVKNNLWAFSFLLCKCGRTSDKTSSLKSMALQMPSYSKYVMNIVKLGEGGGGGGG